MILGWDQEKPEPVCREFFTVEYGAVPAEEAGWVAVLINSWEDKLHYRN